MTKHIIAMTSWNDGKRQYFTLRLDEPAVNPQAFVFWNDSEGKARRSELMVDALYENTVEAHIDQAMDEGFLLGSPIGSVMIKDGGYEVRVNEVEKREPQPSNKLVEYEYEDPSEVTYLYSEQVAVINRLVDYGGSGLGLTQLVADGWVLPGVLSPPVINEDKVKELIDKGYTLDDEALNTCYMIGDELVFIWGNPTGVYQRRINVGDAYSFEYIVEGDSDRRGAPLQQVLGNDLYDYAYRVEDSYDELLAPRVKHFQSDIDTIFSNELSWMGPYENVSAVGIVKPEQTQDRPGDKTFSSPATFYNYTLKQIEGIYG